MSGAAGGEGWGTGEGGDICEGRGGEGGQGEDSVRGPGQGEGNWSSLRVDDAEL